MEGQKGQHDVLNTTLDELEKSLEEVYDSNRLLRDTLGDCNDFIQTNLLTGPHLRPHASTATSASSMRPHSVAPVHMRPHSMAPATVRPHSVTPASTAHHVNYRPHSVMAQRGRCPLFFVFIYAYDKLYQHIIHYVSKYILDVYSFIVLYLFLFLG